MRWRLFRALLLGLTCACALCALFFSVLHERLSHDGPGDPRGKSGVRRQPIVANNNNNHDPDSFKEVDTLVLSPFQSQPPPIYGIASPAIPALEHPNEVTELHSEVIIKQVEQQQQQQQPVVTRPAAVVEPETLPPPPPQEATTAAAKLESSDFLDTAKVALVILAYNRGAMLENTLRAVLALPTSNRYSIFVSQDASFAQVSNVIAMLKSQGLPFEHWHHPHDAVGREGVYYVARHYQFVMNKVFDDQRKFTHAILMEDDLMPAPDFLRMFEATGPLLDVDPSIWCISSWNDYGFKHLTLDKSKFFRTGYFPGLGWMLKRSLWDELRPKFPAEAWDHWMRVDAQHQGRECVVPMLSRNKNVGAEGATMHQAAFQRMIANIAVNEDPDVQYGDLAYLLQDTYKANFAAEFATSKRTSTLPSQQESGTPEVLRYNYKREEFAQLGARLGVLNQPRTFHEYTIRLTMGSTVLFLADVRRSTYLPDSERLFPPANMMIATGDQSESCTAACLRHNRHCVPDGFEFINKCSVLIDRFPCEKGCDFNMGREIPCYVSSPANVRHFGKCLVTDEFAVCGSSHASTTRVCPCV